MSKLIRLTIFLILICSILIAAPVAADSILDIPKRTVFHLVKELEIPANRDFALLGNDMIDESFNGIGQILNNQTGRMLGGDNPAQPIGSGYLAFNNYYPNLFESFEETYNQCLERHRQVTVIPGSPPPSPTIVQNGENNVAIINQVNPSPGTPTTVYSSIGENYCTPPNHTLAALVINRKTADGGGFFAEGYEFKVKNVKYRKRGFYNVVNVYFDHKVLAGLVIVTTRSPETIPISSLAIRSGSSKGGFWSSIGNTLADMSNIGGDYFRIDPPDKRYYD